MNWTSEVFTFLFSSLIMGISLGQIFIQYKKNKNKFLKYFVLANLFIFIYIFLGIFQNLFLSILLFQIRMISILPFGLSIIFSVDHLKHYTIDPKKFLIYGITMGMTFILLLNPDNFIITTLVSGEPTIKNTNGVRIMGIILTLEITSIFFYYTVLIYKNVNLELKPKARLTLIGGIIYGIFPFLVMISKLNNVIPGALVIPLSCGMLIVVRSFCLEPKLMDALLSTSNLARLKLVKKIIPICAYCKSIRDEHDQWSSLENFFNEKSMLKFSHGICPSCIEKYFADFV
jgi:hypothetical protein